MSRARSRIPRALVLALLSLAGILVVRALRSSPSRPPSAAAEKPASSALGRLLAARGRRPPALVDPETQVDPRRLELAPTTPDPDDRVAGATALYRDLIATAGIDDRQEQRLRVAIYLAQEEWFRGEQELETRVLTTVSEPGSHLTDSERVQAAATHDWTGQGEGQPMAKRSTVLLDERLRRVLTPQQIALAVPHPFFSELRHLDDPLFLRR
jgi:hypothetical protein